MTSRIDQIRASLRALCPDEIQVTDQSHLHAGHPGARDGRGHFHVRIVSDKFTGKSLLSRHRMVYAELGTLMETDIHALGIEALTRDEATAKEKT